MSDEGPSFAPQALRDYALLADGERGVLVGPRGDFAWMCFPRWHDDAVFSALIGGRSFYAVSPVGRFVWGGHYDDGTLIWRSRWVTEEGGIVECREALALPARPDRAILLRRAIALRGDARLRVALAAGANFDRRGMARPARRDDGVWTAALGEERMRWYGAAAATPREGGVHGPSLGVELRLEEGEHHDLVLVLDRGEGSEPLGPDRLWAATESSWAERMPDLGDEMLAPRDARHAYAVLSGLTGASGAMVAAATTSLPEHAGRPRNYDYRYAWIRDQAYAGQAVAAVGPLPLLDDAVRFVAGRLRADGPDLMPAYTVEGDPVPGESRLGLPGYPGGVDILGNRVRDQFQLDACGEALLLFAAAAAHDRLDADAWAAAELAAETIERRHTEPEAGIWELELALWT
ncbi:MAG TPA: glycoside hydrolase family 15 protein, partial [Solirubrobacterales bacterium]|nr:glycoside hydrolase family 15 protein [Solirubrobacterales bacterium]